MSTKQELEVKQNQLKAETQQLLMKVTDLEEERKEHHLVIDQMRKAAETNASRRVQRMIGTALVQSNVSNAIEDLELNVKQVVDLQRQISEIQIKKENEIKEFEATNGAVLGIKPSDHDAKQRLEETKEMFQ